MFQLHSSLSARSLCSPCGARSMATPQFLFRKGIQLGFDGSLVDDGDWVYVLGIHSQWEEHTVQQIDYFHGMVGGAPIAQMTDESDCSATHMIALQLGFTAIRITNVQRRWRQIRALRYRRNMLKFGIAIAKICLKSE